MAIQRHAVGLAGFRSHASRRREAIRSAGRNWTNPGDCTANLEVVRQFDWKQIAALIEP